MKLIPNAKRWYRMACIWAMSLAGAVQTTWELVPPDLKSGVPPKAVYAVTMALLAFGVIGRLVQQPKVQTPKGPQ